MRHPKGFTLVELLVVMAVITLLIALLMPALKGARGLAQASVCASNLRSVYQAEASYASEYDGCVGYACLSNNAVGGWEQFLYGGPSAGSAPVPAYTMPIILGDTKNANTKLRFISKVMLCPTWYPYFPILNGSGGSPNVGQCYGFNSSSVNYNSATKVISGIAWNPQRYFAPVTIAWRSTDNPDLRDTTINPSGFGKLYFLKLPQVEAPATGVFLADSVKPDDTGVNTSGQTDLIDLNTFTQSGQRTYPAPFTTHTNTQAAHLRHNNSTGNFLFYDGHADRLGFSDMKQMGVNAYVDESMIKYDKYGP